VSGTSQSGVHVFKGVPYGTAARFRRATPPPAWTGVRTALEYGPAAMQNKSALCTDPRMSEDCLLLNVWTAWIAFARTGNPSTAALGTWSAYERRERATMILGAETKVEKDPDGTIRRLWGDNLKPW